MMSKDVLAAIQAGKSGFSKGQRAIAEFILKSYDKAAFMTAGKLGRTVGVSESTVVRFAAELGYDGYPAMQRTLREMIRGKLTSIQRIEVSNDLTRTEDILPRVMQMDMENIHRTFEEMDRAGFDATVDAIVGAKRIYILGIRSASALAGFLGFYFNLIFENVTVVHTSTVSEVFEQILRVEEGDVVVGISFPRYSQRTVKAMRFAHDRGATVVAITDGNASPLVPIADHALLAKSDMASFVDSLVAPLSLVNALIMAVGRRKSGELSRTFETLERIWDEYDVYEKADIHD